MMALILRLYAFSNSPLVKISVLFRFNINQFNKIYTQASEKKELLKFALIIQCTYIFVIIKKYRKLANNYQLSRCFE